MNYRHAYHAGSFADVFKHAIYALILRYQSRKDTPFRVIDTHAGVGIYDLGDERAARTGEWRDGVGRIDAVPVPEDVAALLAPWREAVRALQTERGASFYPGSPELARRLTRGQDRLILVEKHPEDARALADAMAGDRRAKVVVLDGWTALKAFVPPPEKRGVVLVDPPFEDRGEFARMAQTVADAWLKWPTGVYALWYPIKDRRDADAFVASFASGPVRKSLRLELMLDDGRDPSRLNGCGLVVVNPPWTLRDDAMRLLPWLASVLGRSSGGGSVVETLSE